MAEQTPQDPKHQHQYDAQWQQTLESITHNLGLSRLIYINTYR